MKDIILEALAIAACLILFFGGIVIFTVSIVLPVASLINGMATAALWWCLPGGIVGLFMIVIVFSMTSMY